MGEIADMMIEGTLCEGCGVYIGNATGFTRRCSDCNPSKSNKNHWKKVKEIKKELQTLKKKLTKENFKGNVTEEARRQINVKHGHGWRFPD